MNNNALALANSPYALSIKTADGQEIQVAPGNSLAGNGGSVVDMLPNGGDRPLARLTVVQPRDPRGLDQDWQGQFVLQQSERAVNEKGVDERISTYSQPLGIRIQVRVVGYTLNRSMMGKYDPRAVGPDANRPLCHSENFIMPDAEYDGKYSHQCVAPDTRRGGTLVAVCPMAAWGARDKVTKKSEPPSCHDEYILALAIKIDDQWIVCEARFKSAGAKSGRTIIQQLRALELKGYPLYMYPVELWVTEAGVGNSMAGRLMIPPTTQSEVGTPEETDLEGLEAGRERWAQALAVRNERASRVYRDDEAEDTSDSAADAAFGPVVTNPALGPIGNFLAEGDRIEAARTAPIAPPIVAAAPAAPAAPKPAATRLPKKQPMV